MDGIVMRQSPAVEKSLNPFQYIVTALAGWMNHRQQNVIEYLREENRVLREQLGRDAETAERFVVRSADMGKEVCADYRCPRNNSIVELKRRFPIDTRDANHQEWV